MLVARSMHEQWLSNAYVIGDAPGGTAVFVDSGAPLAPLLELVERERLTPTHLLRTHAHGDHVEHETELCDRYGIPVVTGDLVTGGLSVRAIALPGHSDDGLAFVVNDEICFSGDVLFKDAVGGGPADVVQHSVMEGLMTLVPEIRVLPGHTEETTIGREWEHNPFVTYWRGAAPSLGEAVKVAGEDAELVVWSPDYDGNGKALVRFPDGSERIVGGSRVTPEFLSGHVRLIVARCEVTYSGRLDAVLPEAVRLLMLKSDGSFLVHADTGGFKPQNWMTPPTVIEHEGEPPERIVVRKRAGKTEDRLDIRIVEILSDVEHDMGEAAALAKDGVERDLQLELAGRPDVLGEGLHLVEREWQTDIGPVDLMCRDRDGAWVAVEIKRIATIDAVEQLSRYLERIQTLPGMAACRGILAGQKVVKQARTLAESRGLAWVEVDLASLRGEKEPELTLFEG